LANAGELRGNPTGGTCALRPGDATLFIEGSVDDAVIEDLFFAFATFDWEGFKVPSYERPAEVVPAYAALKHLFLPGDITIGPEPVRLRADSRILPLLKAGDIESATNIAVHRLRIARLKPLNVSYRRGVDSCRLAAALLIPVWPGKALSSGIFHEHSNEAYG
jgi:CRISPR-associated protein Csx17